MYTCKGWLNVYGYIAQGADLDVVYPDMCAEVLKKYPFWRTCQVKKHTHNEGIFHIIHTIFCIYFGINVV